jgi:hypothetical protein
MEMVWHDHPSQRVGEAVILCLSELMNHQSAKAIVPENGLSSQGVGSQQINSILLGIATDAQAM